MASYHFDGNNWIKQCSHCKEVTTGTSDLNESITIFSEMFADAGPSSGMADGFQSRCWMCNSAKRRDLGVTRPIIESMMIRQGGCCAICNRGLSISRNALPVNKANVDHNEATGSIRELLCGNCNRGIGLFIHNPETLIKAAEYCSKHKPKILQIRRRA